MNKIYYYVVILISVIVIGFIAIKIFNSQTQETQSLDSATNVSREDETVDTSEVPDTLPSTSSIQSIQAEPEVITPQPEAIPAKEASKPVATQTKTKIDVYGVDLYTLKQGVTSIKKSTPVEIQIVYIRNGNAVEYSMTDSTNSRNNESAKYSSITYLKPPIDKYGTDLTQLKEGKTIINTTIYTDTKITYTRSGNTIETKVFKEGLSSSGNSTVTIELPN